MTKEEALTNTGPYKANRYPILLLKRKDYECFDFVDLKWYGADFGNNSRYIEVGWDIIGIQTETNGQLFEKEV